MPSWSATSRSPSTSPAFRGTCCAGSARYSTWHAGSARSRWRRGGARAPPRGGGLRRRLGPLLDMARRLGRLALALVDGPVTAVEVDYGGRDDTAPRPVLMAAVEGMLSAMSVEPVRLVNALLLAAERGI